MTEVRRLNLFSRVTATVMAIPRLHPQRVKGACLQWRFLAAPPPVLPWVRPQHRPRCKTCHRERRWAQAVAGSRRLRIRLKCAQPWSCPMLKLNWKDGVVFFWGTVLSVPVFSSISCYPMLFQSISGIHLLWRVFEVLWTGCLNSISDLGGLDLRMPISPFPMQGWMRWSLAWLVIWMAQLLSLAHKPTNRCYMPGRRAQGA